MEKASCILPTSFGMIHFKIYEFDGEKWFVLVFGILSEKNVFCRIHDACITSEVFYSNKCDCALQLKETMKFLQKNSGIIIYTPHEGRGSGILKKIEAYAYQSCDGFNTVQADTIVGEKSESRNYAYVKAILNDLHIKHIMLITNNNYKVDFVKNLGILCDKIELPYIYPWKNSIRYLNFKNQEMDHNIQIHHLNLESINCIDHIKKKLDTSTNNIKIVTSFATFFNGVYCSNENKPIKISNDETWKICHYIRSFCDFILVGSNTIINDDPLLTCRVCENSNPVKVILSSKPEKIPRTSRVFQNGKTFIMCPVLNEKKEDESVIYFDGTMEDMLSKLGEKGCTSLMVEGGNNVIKQFLKISDIVIWTQSLSTHEGCKFDLGEFQFKNPKTFNFNDNIIVCGTC
tara:strand:+ start:4925 stop:6133 length:1209 start_codon:yes stop_codon:yes gene_type:complete